jgi:hypothetical protein
LQGCCEIYLLLYSARRLFGNGQAVGRVRLFGLSSTWDSRESL